MSFFIIFFIKFLRVSYQFTVLIIENNIFMSSRSRLNIISKQIIYQYFMGHNQVTKLLTSLITLLAQTTGRDKICRLFQYGGQYLGQSYRQKNIKDLEVSAAKWERVSSEMRMVRKILRFLRTLQYSRKVIDKVKKLRSQRNTPLIQKLITIFEGLSNLFTFLFFMFDHRVCLAEIGVISKDNHKVNFGKSFRYWLLECLFSILRDITQCIQMVIDDNGNEEKFRALLLNIFKNFLDFMIALSVLRQGPLQKKTIGSFGTISSLIGIYQLWK